MKATAETNEDAIVALIKNVSANNANNAAAMVAVAKALAELKTETGKPRKPVFDNAGNIIGVEVVDTLH